ncbi:RnfABCDGE type electron transport complex subunit B, partial [Candidatus Aerophobetes bacterium]|nr:RnfABCDGE type electron transport complex subunit B [Candidatus Aerophobetes bacterium]
MNLIILSTVSMGALAAFFAVMLSIAHSRLKVEEDPRINQIEEELPGVNCGACGFASCHALAEAIVKGEAEVNSCLAGGSAVAEKISRIVGKSAKAVDRKFAFVKCGASFSEREKKALYEGVKTCGAANIIMGADTACKWGCLGFGDCERACPFGAIKMINGLPQIDFSLCTGCGKCVQACPRNIIILDSFNKINYMVKCSSLDVPKVARRVCKKACIACGRCVKFCPYDACWLENNLSFIDRRNCQT